MYFDELSIQVWNVSSHGRRILFFVSPAQTPNGVGGCLRVPESSARQRPMKIATRRLTISFIVQAHQLEKT